MAESLKSLGFGDEICSMLSRRVSFKPSNFALSVRIEKDKDVVWFYLFFEKTANNNYTCNYYDAVLRKEIKIPNTTINHVDTKELEQRMSSVDWCGSFNEEKVEAVVTDLIKLEENEEGKMIADRLKVKFWSDTPIEEMINNASSLKTRFEISQRFYLEDMIGISTEEAYRFLHNRWLEKQLQLKKKQTENNQKDDSNEDTDGSGGDRLLQKKIRTKRKGLKV